MDITTLVFLVVAVLIFFRLRRVLGSRTGHERNPLDKKWPVVIRDIKKLEPRVGVKPAPLPATPKFESVEKVIEPVAPGSALAIALKPVTDADPKFDAANFMKGAKAAYEMVLTAFARNDREKLRPLVSSDLFSNFDEEITGRETRRETVDFHFIGISSADVTDAIVRDGDAQVSVLIKANLVQATRGENGEVIEGDATAIAEVDDIWTFERKISSPDPNWKLVATEDA